MSIRTISIDIDTAKQLYHEGGFKRDLALQSYTEEELLQNWEYIKTFEDACKALHLDVSKINIEIAKLETALYSKMLIAQYKLAIIRMALNGEDWNPADSRAAIPNLYVFKHYIPEPDDKAMHWYEEIGRFSDSNCDYVFALWSDESELHNSIFAFDNNFRSEFGYCNASASLLLCRTNRIARHLVRNFAEIVFDAIYGQYIYGQYSFVWKS